MKILFAPAKTFNENVKSKKQKGNFRKETIALVNLIKSWNKDELSIKFKTSESLSEDVYLFYQTFDYEYTFEAFSLYQGVSYLFLDYPSLSESEKKRLNAQVIVIDALYGIIKPFDFIRPYRLDFTVKGLNLRSIWKPVINAYLEKLDEPILSLTSTEFSSLINRDIPIYDVSFLDCKNEKCKAISVFNKQNRGALLRYIIQENIMKIDDLPEVFNGYQKSIDSYHIIYKKGV
jgi:hypothetical protein